MALYATAYDTTVGKGFLMDKVKAALSKVLVQNSFAVTNNAIAGIDMPVFQSGCTPSLVTPFSDEEMSVPVFTHPIFIDISGVKRSASETYMISDARPYLLGRVGDRPDKAAFRNKSEFDFTKNRTVLSSFWYKGNVNSFKFLSDAVARIYTDWISNTITRIFALDGSDQQYISILASYFWQSLFSEDSVFTSEQEQLKMVRLCSKASYASVDRVLEVISANPTMGNIKDLCEAISRTTDNPRLQDLNAGLLVNAIHTSWMGNNGREIAAVSLEHVPTFVMMVYSAFTERSYKKTPLGKIAEKYKGSKGEDEFLRAYTILTKKISQDE